METDQNILSLSEAVRMLNSVTLGSELMVAELSGRDMAERYPMRVDALCILFVRSGSASIGIDLVDYTLSRDDLVVIQPRKFIHSFSCSADFTACIMACSQTIFEQIRPRLDEVLPLFLYLRTEPKTHLSASEAASISEYYAFLRRRLALGPTPHQQQKIIALMQSALYELLDIYTVGGRLQGYRRSRKEEIMARFIMAVSDNFRTERGLGFYAAELGMSAKHLSAVVKQISGRTAGEWIENYVIMEAKVLLSTTDLPIQEIACRLNFANQSFFGKYFKNLTGISPTRFRNSD